MRAALTPRGRGAFDLDRFLALPRVSGLLLSPDGQRLVATVATVAPDRKRFVSAVWELDPSGRRQPRRLTRSAVGETAAAFLPDGSLLFTSTRKDPDSDAAGDAGKQDGDEEIASLWLLPAGGGEARQVAATAWLSSLFPGAEGVDDDRRRAKARTDAGVTALLFESYPVRFWDHWLGPREPRLFCAPPPAGDQGRLGADVPLLPAAGRALDEASFALTPDGSTLVTTWASYDDVRNPRTQLVAVATASGERRVLLDDPESSVDAVACSPDGHFVVCQRAWHGSPDEAPDATLWLLDLASGQGRDLLPGFELWPEQPVWAPDGQAVYFVADQAGRTPVFRVEVSPAGDGAPPKVTRLSADGCFSDLCPAPDGRRLYALRSTLTAPPGLVALDATAADKAPVPLPSPGLPVELPGRVSEVHAVAADGTPLRGWLVLPPAEGAGERPVAAAPAPLLTIIHGGPLASWSGWHWRWNPQLLAARGYACLLPDPALSTGYGRAFIARGRGRWGREPYTDVLALVDAAEARPDIDETRSAVMGGSFGGYLANWVAGHSSRFRCVVSHASLWSLEQFRGTTDDAGWWDREFGSPEEAPDRYRDNSPSRHADAIRVPMLVIHGERDYRVPIGEALRLWTDLRWRGVEAKFLCFPDEHHWILKPQHIRIWYETVLAFLDQHVLGKDWVRPELL